MSLLTRGLRRTFTSAMSSSDIKSCRVAALQLNCSQDKTANMTRCQSLMESAVTAGARVLFLPEAFDFVASCSERVWSLSEDQHGPLVSSYRDLARRLGVWLSLGGLHERPSGGAVNKVLNTHVLIDSRGDIVADYNKTHLFDVHSQAVQLEESRYVSRGSRLPAVIDSPAGLLAPMVCYDVRFAEMALLARRAGAQVLLYPSAFTAVTGAAHWHVLMRARALDSQCFVIAAAQVGQHGGSRCSYGHTVIVDPWGDILAEATGAPGGEIVMADLDFTRLQQVRQQMPVERQRRHDLYTAVAPVPRPPSLSANTTLPSVDQSFQFGHVLIHSSMVFYMTDLSFAFVNLRCVVPGHVLVAARGPSVERLHQLSARQIADLFCCVQLVQRLMERVHQADSSTVCVQDGPAAGQTVRHVHVHVLPRRPSDFAFNDHVYQQLHEHDKDDSRPSRNEREMRRECDMLRREMSLLQHVYDA